MNINPIRIPQYISGSLPITGTSSVTGDDGMLPHDSFSSTGTESSLPLEKIGNSENSPVESRSIFRICESGISPIPRLPNGGYLVEEDTGTVAFFGDSAKELLKNTRDYDRETVVILPNSGNLEVTVDRETFSVAESASILLGPGAKADFRKLDGNLMVIQTEKAPDWYKKLKPEGEMSSEFERITRVNQKLFNCETGESRFKLEDLRRLLDYGIVSRNSAGEGTVKWDSSIKSQEEMKSRLIESGFTGKAIDENTEIWVNTIKRKLYAGESGHTREDKFTPQQLEKLVDAGLMFKNQYFPGQVHWTGYSTESEFRGKLDAAQITGQDQEDVMQVWKKTTRSGYDNTGLSWDKGKVVAYLLREKLNIWNEHATEWFVNSTGYCGENEPFTVGVSEVRSKEAFPNPVPFRDIRAKEQLHRHPVREDKKQTESYMVHDGEAVLLTMLDGKPNLTFMKAGDMAVISPGIPHCVLAARGNYEHICFQVPSAFQYGFLFKDELTTESFGVSEEALVKAAFRGLEEGRHGTVNADQLMVSG